MGWYSKDVKSQENKVHKSSNFQTKALDEFETRGNKERRSHIWRFEHFKVKKQKVSVM